MTRIVYVHWNPSEAETKAAALRAEGYEVTTHSSQSGEAMRAYRDDPPDGFVIDLSRSPSTGQAVAIALRQGKATRRAALVFVDGAEDKVARVRGMLPDAAYTTTENLLPALREALAHPLDNPVVPGTMDGYSGMPLVKKLGIRDGSRVALCNAPEGFTALLGDLPTGAQLLNINLSTTPAAAGEPGASVAAGPGSFAAGAPITEAPDVLLLFLRSQRELEAQFLQAAQQLARGGKLWVIWPKKTSAIAADLSETQVRAHGLAHGWVDFKIAAIDATWSGLCFALRKK